MGARLQILKSTTAAAVLVTALAACSQADTNADAVVEEAAAIIEESALVLAQNDVDAAPAAPTVEDARAFIEAAEAELLDTYEFEAQIYWIYETFISHDTEALVERVGTDGTVRGVRLANGTKAFEGLDLPLDLQRRMDALRQGLTLPAPETEGAAAELAAITTAMSSAYSNTTVEIGGVEHTLNELEELMGTERDPAVLEEMWTQWRTVGPQMHEDYARMVEIANEGARELGFDDVGQMWLSGYDMPADEMAAEVERLWGQVEPLYEQLHCHVRARLNEEHGDDVVPLDQPIRADLLGNMWAQQWANVYDLVAPESGGPSYDLTALLVDNGYDARRMVETGEAFFSSLGFDPLPETFWERSIIEAPEGRTNLVCHASAWDITSEDIRIKMCTRINADDFQTVHHELGHNYYQRAYGGQDFLYRTGAHDGFHEAIGDFIGLSITPDYLRQIGLITEEQIPDASADIGLLMNQALDKIAFLPFGYLMDQWRWQVFSGEIAPEDYTDAWWELRTRYQGIQPPGDARPGDAFDPGAKYHIPNNVPYLRYFLSFVMQFQFHEAACDMMGWEGPLHRCSIYGSDEVGERFNAMLEMGASQPWPDALEAFTGTREMDGSAIISYFQPLMDHLEEENAGRQCGWDNG